MTDNTKKGINWFTAGLSIISVLFILVDKAFAPAISKTELVNRIAQVERDQQKLCTVPEDLAVIKTRLEVIQRDMADMKGQLKDHIEVSHK